MANQVAITLKKSSIGSTKTQKATLEVLGLKKIRQTVVHPNSTAVQGMIKKVNHLIEVEEVK